jgi:hypothetical protein
VYPEWWFWPERAGGRGVIAGPVPVSILNDSSSFHEPRGGPTHDSRHVGQAGRRKTDGRSETEPHQAAHRAHLTGLTEQAAGRRGRPGLAAVERVAAPVDARERTREPTVAGRSATADRSTTADGEPSGRASADGAAAARARGAHARGARLSRQTRDAHVPVGATVGPRRAGDALGAAAAAGLTRRGAARGRRHLALEVHAPEPLRRAVDAGRAAEAARVRGVPAAAGAALTTPVAVGARRGAAGARASRGRASRGRASCGRTSRGRAASGRTSATAPAGTASGHSACRAATCRAAARRREAAGGARARVVAGEARAERTDAEATADAGEAARATGRALGAGPAGARRVAAAGARRGATARRGAARRRQPRHHTEEQTEHQRRTCRDHEGRSEDASARQGKCRRRLACPGA